MPKRRNPNHELASERLRKVIRDSGKTQEQFAESLCREGYQTKQQNVQRYANDIFDVPQHFAREVSRVYGCNYDWLLGDPDAYETDAERAAAYISELQGKKNRSLLWFELTARLAGWQIEYLADREDVAAPYTGAGADYDDTLTGVVKFKSYVRMSKGKKPPVTLDKVAFDALIDKQLASFDLDCTYLPRFMTKEV